MVDGGYYGWADSMELDELASLAFEDRDAFRSRQMPDDDTSWATSSGLPSYLAGKHPASAARSPSPKEPTAFAVLHRSRKGVDAEGDSERPLSYVERLQRLRGSGAPPNSIDVVRQEIRGSGSALQRSINVSEAILASSKNFHEQFPPALRAMLDYDFNKDSTKTSQEISSIIQDEVIDGTRQQGRSSSKEGRGNGWSNRSASASRARLNPSPWPHGVRPSIVAAGAVSRPDFFSKSQDPRSSSSAPFSVSDSALDRLVKEESWADQRRLNNDRNKSAPNYHVPLIASQSLSVIVPVQQDTSFRFGDKNIWRSGVARAIRNDASDAVELVGVGAHAHPLFKPTFNPTPRRIKVGA